MRFHFSNNLPYLTQPTLLVGSAWLIVVTLMWRRTVRIYDQNERFSVRSVM